MNYLERHEAHVLLQRKIKERAERGSVKKKKKSYSPHCYSRFFVPTMKYAPEQAFEKRASVKTSFKFRRCGKKGKKGRKE